MYSVSMTRGTVYSAAGDSVAGAFVLSVQRADAVALDLSWACACAAAGQPVLRNVCFE
jgi:fructose-1-phosphate kinase PfkB-like protein